MKNMKFLKIIIVVFLIMFYGHTAFAQNNLQFNAAKYIQLNCTTSGCRKDTVIVVPTNKVLKIENGSTNIAGTDILLNGMLISSHYSTLISVFPIWLPTGSYTFTLAGCSCSTFNSCFLSGVEFNIVP